jgi:hypothetical protein
MNKDVITVAIDRQIAKEVKIQAAVKGDTVKGVIEAAVTEYLRKSKGDTNQDRRHNEPGQETK